MPTFANGLGRGCLPADHELSFARARVLLQDRGRRGRRSSARRWTSGSASASSATPRSIHVVDARARPRHARARRASRSAGDLARRPGRHRRAHRGPGPTTSRWIARLRDRGGRGPGRGRGRCWRPTATRSSPPGSTASCAACSTATRSWSATAGDFVSYAGKYLDSHEPGCWLDPGPYGCLGTGMGYAMAARVAHPDRQVVVLMGDGAAGFSLMDVDSLVRHSLPVVIVVGNNGIWGLEKHPMQSCTATTWPPTCSPGMPVRRGRDGAGRRRRDGGAARGHRPRAATGPSTAACPTWSTS